MTRKTKPLEGVLGRAPPIGGRHTGTLASTVPEASSGKLRQAPTEHPLGGQTGRSKQLQGPLAGCPDYDPHGDSCRFNLEDVFCRRVNHLLCDEHVAELHLPRGREVLLLQRQDQLTALAEKMDHLERVGIHVLSVGDGPERVARGLVLALDDGQLHLVDLGATQTLGPLDDVLPRLRLVGHDLKPQFIALAAWLSKEPLDLFDTKLAVRILDGGRLPGTSEHSLREVVHRYLGRQVAARLGLPWTGHLSLFHLRAAGQEAELLLPLADKLCELLERNELSQTADIEFAVLPAVVEMEIAGMGVDMDAWIDLTVERAEVVGQLENRLCAALRVPDVRHAARTKDGA